MSKKRRTPEGRLTLRGPDLDAATSRVPRHSPKHIGGIANWQLSFNASSRSMFHGRSFDFGSGVEREVTVEPARARAQPEIPRGGRRREDKRRKQWERRRPASARRRPRRRSAPFGKGTSCASCAGSLPMTPTTLSPFSKQQEKIGSTQSNRRK